MPALGRPSPLGGQKGAATVSEQILEPSRLVTAEACGQGMGATEAGRQGQAGGWTARAA